MSTRGLMGFRIEGKDKLTYNHSDSYPEGLGNDLVGALIGADGLLKDLDGLYAKAKALRVIKGNKPATKEDIAKYGKHLSEGVSTGKPTEWYCLLRNLQGDLRGTLDAGIMIDGKNFIKESLFCEWAYIINLDAFTFEVYKGFQDKPHKAGRYAKAKPYTSGSGTKYYACALVAEIPFETLNKHWMDRLPKEEEVES